MRLCVKEKVPQAGGNQKHLLLSFRQEFRMELRPTNKGGRHGLTVRSPVLTIRAQELMWNHLVSIFVHWLLTW